MLAYEASERQARVPEAMASMAGQGADGPWLTNQADSGCPARYGLGILPNRNHGQAEPAHAWSAAESIRIYTINTRIMVELTVF